jgi:hypothetical protein
MRSFTNRAKGATDANMSHMLDRDTMATMTNGRKYVTQGALSATVLPEDNPPPIAFWRTWVKRLSRLQRNTQKQQFPKFLRYPNSYHHCRQMDPLQRRLTTPLGNQQHYILGHHQPYRMDPGMRSTITMSATSLGLTLEDHQEGLGLTAEGTDLMSTGCLRDITAT